METINTTIPLSEEELDKYFDNIENYFFNIDYQNINLKSEFIINYIYNSEMNCNITNLLFDKKLEKLLLEYITTDKLLSIDSINNLWIKILYYKIGKLQLENLLEKNFIEDFIKNHDDLIQELLSILYCLKVFLVNVVFKEEIKAPNKTFSYIGNNFISLRNDDNFWTLLSDVDELNLKYYNYKNFDEPIFDGFKIAHFFYDEFTPLSILRIISTTE